tara:strand:+ start:858 stop:1160 length:303 start_codon:yes stop_codon:yes gene_type:complete
METNHTLTTDVGIIEMTREKWNTKRYTMIEMRDKKVNAGNEELAVITLNMLIDQAQETISDLTESIQKMKSLAEYHNNAQNLIKNLTNKTKKNASKKISS